MAVLVLCFLVGDFSFVEAGQRGLLVQRSTYLLGQMSRDEFLDQQINVMPVFRYANANLPSDAVLFLLPYENRGYYLERKYIWGHPISQRIVRFEEYNTVTELAETLRQMRITQYFGESSLDIQWVALLGTHSGTDAGTGAEM